MQYGGLNLSNQSSQKYDRKWGGTIPNFIVVSNKGEFGGNHSPISIFMKYWIEWVSKAHITLCVILRFGEVCEQERVKKVRKTQMACVFTLHKV